MTVTYRLNGQRRGIEKWSADITGLCREHIEKQLQQVSYAVIDKQVKLGNEMSELLVDSASNKPLTSAKKKVEARFGSAFDRTIIDQVERTLARNILDVGAVKSGRLREVRSNWTWYLQDFTDGKSGKAQKINPRKLTTLQRQQRLLLVPTGVVNDKGEPYATAAEIKLMIGTRKGGFMYRTAKSLNRNRKIGRFYKVKVLETKKNALPGEPVKKGTKLFALTPSFRRASRRRR